MCKAVIMMGSLSDKSYVDKIAETLSFFDIECEMRVASAHKTAKKVLKLINEYSEQKCVFITVAGRSNALSGMVDGLTSKPVIASPPVSDKFAGMDILSSLRMPSGVAPLTVLGAEQCALAAAKIISLANPAVAEKINQYHKKNAEILEKADMEVK